MPELRVADRLVRIREWVPEREVGLPTVLVHGHWASHHWWIAMAEQL